MAEQPVALITGASRGIGRLLASHFGQRGYVVIGVSRGPVEAPPCNGYLHHALDVGDEVAVRRMANELRRQFGRLDVLVNAAGVGLAAPTLLTTAAAAELSLRTNLLGTILVAREVAKLMLKQGGGRIVNLSSIAVPLNMEGAAVYTATKSGVEQFSRVLARELADAHITCNVVAPALVDTDMLAQLGAEARARYLAALTIKRLVTPAELCHAVEFFAHELSGCITGQVLRLCLAV